MPVPYYDRVINLFKQTVTDNNVSVAEILKTIENGENKAGITKSWLHSVYNEVPADPGIKRMDELYRVLNKINRRIGK